MALRYDTVTFLSDFGRTDEFVGVVHSILHANAPGVRIVDLTHDVERHNVRAGGLTLARAAQYLCPGVVLAVVDPGVGSDRRSIAIEVGDGQSVLVGPDNGLLAPAVAFVGGASRAVVLTNTDWHLPAPGATFAGRDVYAPVAAALCMGADLGDLGDPIGAESLIPGLLPVATERDGALVGEVVWVDHFGNCQLNVSPDDIEDWGRRVKLSFGDDFRVVTRTDNYASIGRGETGLVVDSYGVLSVALDRMSAATELGLHEGSEVRLSRVDDSEGPTVTTPVTMGMKPSTTLPEERPQ